ncbi:MAG: WD40 repeat domain-containing protein [Chloroflexaceae bacterium]|nr:WD40 repeat domain-containing protein [Chloroflexaceae bacterium]
MHDAHGPDPYAPQRSQTPDSSPGYTGETVNLSGERGTAPDHPEPYHFQVPPANQPARFERVEPPPPKPKSDRTCLWLGIAGTVLAVALVCMGIGIIGALTVLGSQVSEVFSEIASGLEEPSSNGFDDFDDVVGSTMPSPLYPELYPALPATGMADLATVETPIIAATAGDMELVRVLRMTGGVGLQVDYAPDGSRIAVATDSGVVHIWNIAEQATERVLEADIQSLYDVAFSPDGQTVAAGDANGTIWLWNVADGSLLTTFTPDVIAANSIVFAPDGQTLAVGNAEGEVFVLEPADGTVLATLHTDDTYFSIQALAFSPDGQRLAAGTTDGSILVWDVDSSMPRYVLEGHTDWVRGVAFSPDGSLLASGSDDNTARIWNVAQGNEVHVLEGHSDWVRSVMFSPDGQTVITASDDTTVRLWDVGRGTQQAMMGDDTLNWLNGAALSPDGQIVAATYYDGALLLWDIRNERILATLQADTYNSILSVVLGADDTALLAAGKDGAIQRWQLPEAIRIPPLSGLEPHTGSILSLAYGPDGRTVALG